MAHNGGGRLSAVVVDGLVRSFRSSGNSDVLALDGVSLVVGDGEFHGLLGPNGAGKTTLLKVISTILLPTAGSVAVFGHDVVADPAHARRTIGLVLGGDRGLYGRLTGRQNLEYWGSLHRLSRRVAHDRADRLLADVGLQDKADVRVEEFSRGMKQRLHVARGMIGDPSLLILDEPTVGLDPQANIDLRALLKQQAASGVSILMATHDLRLAEALCDTVHLLDEGRILASEDPRSLSRLASGPDWVEAYRPTPEQLTTLSTVGRPDVDAVLDPGWIRLRPTGSDLTALLSLVVELGITDVRTVPPSLEETYLRAYGAERA